MVKNKTIISFLFILTLLPGIENSHSDTDEDAISGDTDPAISLAGLKHRFRPSQDNFQVSSRKEVESLLLPLEISKFNLLQLDLFPNDKEIGQKAGSGRKAGGLCTTNKYLYIFDQFGNMLRWNKKLEEATLIENVEQIIIEKAKIPEFPLIFKSAACRDTEKGEEIFMAFSQKTDNRLVNNSYIFEIIKLDDREFEVRKVISIPSDTYNQSGRLSFYENSNLLMTYSAAEILPKDQVLQENGLYKSMDPVLPSGKVLIIDTIKGSWKTFSMGHRNQLGLAYEDGVIYATENGPKGGDELNIIEINKNYGWPKESYGVDYALFTPVVSGPPGRHDNYAKPVFSWIPSIAISSLIKIKAFHPAWTGDLLISSLKAMSLFRVRVDKNKLEFVEQIYIGHRVRDLVEDKDLGIFLVTDDRMLLHITTPKVTPQNRTNVYSRNPKFVNTCLQCHHLGPTNPTSSAPSLTNIFSRNMGSDNFDYSDALRKRNGEQWTPEKMTAFLKDPQAYIPGTTMSFQIEDQSDIPAIVNLLEKMDGNMY